MRVKDMSRRQQKAFFANIGNSSSSSLSNSDRDKILAKEFKKSSSKSLDIRKKRLTLEEFKRSEFAKTKLEAYHWKKKKWVSQDMEEKYVEFTLKYHADKPDTGDFLDKQFGYNKSGDTPVYGR